MGRLLIFTSIGIASILGIALFGASPFARFLSVLGVLALVVATWLQRVVGPKSGTGGESPPQSSRSGVADDLAAGLDVAVFQLDERMAIEYANPAASTMFRFPDPVGRTLISVTLSHELDELVREAAASRSKQRREVSFAYPEGRTTIAQAWPALDATSTFLTLYETTDLRRLERIRQDFVANVSHELRTPLTTIRAMAETLQEEPDNRELSARYLDKIVGEVDRLSSIAEDLLILSAAESSPVRKHACEISAVFRAAVQLLQSKAKAKGLDLAYDGIPTLDIEANAAQMSQVAINLVDNAINYTAEGSIRVGLVQEGDAVVIEVVDTGIGIASEHLPRIFERFYRVDKGRSRATGGTGLGLSIVRNIVEAHGGQVSVESTLNKGSKFIVRLPIGHPSSDESSEPTSP